MTAVDLDAAAAAPQPEVLHGIPLTEDRALIPRVPELNLPTFPSNGKLSSWELIPHAATLARMVAGTDFVPSSLRGKPASVAALFLLGHELGLGPMAALQAMTVTPHKTDTHGNDKGGDIITYAKTLRAITRSHGHKLWPDKVEYTSLRVTWHGYRADDPDHVMSITWTMDEARIAGLLEMPYGKPGPWQKQPRAQLSARASAELCRILDEDGLLGISRVVEELDDDERESVDIVETTTSETEHKDEPAADAPDGPKTRRRSTRARTEVAGQPEPTPPLPVPGDEPSAPAEDSSSPADPGLHEHVAAMAAQEQLAVPGDESTPTIPDVQRASGEQTIREGMPVDQLIAMLCREASVDKAELVRILTDKRSESAKDLSPTMQAFAIDNLRALQRGEVTYNAQMIPPFVPVSELRLADKAKTILSTLGVALRPTLSTLGWSEDRDGRVTEWIATADRAKLLEIIAAATAAKVASSNMEATE